MPWGHAHGPEPEELAGAGGWRRGLSAIVAVGLRPCSGAIIVLVFALAQGLFWAGIASTFVMGLGTAITVAAIATLVDSLRIELAPFGITTVLFEFAAVKTPIWAKGRALKDELEGRLPEQALRDYAPVIEAARFAS